MRGQALPAGLAALTRDLGLAPEQARGDLLRLSRRAMGCRFEVIVPLGTLPLWDPEGPPRGPEGPAGEEAPVEAAREGLDLVDDLERQMTIYREDSEVSQINRTAAGGPVAVEPGLFGLLQTAARLSEETRGAFDITGLPLSRLWQECRQRGTLPSRDEIRAARARVGMRHVRLRTARRTIEFARQGVQLDLASIGKGYALDRVAALLSSRGVGPALVHGGHSSIRAMGQPPWDSAWVLRVQHPLRPKQAIATIRLGDQAMATSAVGEAMPMEQGEGRRCLLDPRTGQPARGAVGATVVAPSAAQADALATAFCVMGVDKARAYCRDRPRLGALLVEARGDEAQPVVIGLADDVEVVR